jgi:hypothetical protein
MVKAVCSWIVTPDKALAVETVVKFESARDRDQLQEAVMVGFLYSRRVGISEGTCDDSRISKVSWPFHYWIHKRTEYSLLLQ